MTRWNIGIFLYLLCSLRLATAQSQPNILWLTIEDTSPQYIGCYGNEDASTPVIDKLATDGVRFTNAFSTGTVCSPSRSAIITGVHTFKLGSGNHRSTYPVPSYIKGFPYYMQKVGYYVTNNSKTDYNVKNMQAFTAEAWNESSNQAGWWNRKKGQPFFSVFNFADSHQSRTMTHTYEWYEKHVLSHLSADEIIAEEEFDMPPYYRDTPEMRKHVARVYNSIKLTDKKIGRLLKRLEEDHLRDSTIIFFFADHGEGMPRGKTNGIGQGYRVPFVIWFPEMYKHLSPWGEAGVITDELIDFEDLAPTVLKLAGGEVPEHMKGRVLMGDDRSEENEFIELSSDRADNGPDLVRSITDGKFMYSRNFMPFLPAMRYIRYIEVADVTNQMRQDLKEGLLNEVQKEMFAERKAEVLYNIDDDLWEIRDLSEDPKYEKVLVKMRKMLDEKILASRDVHFLPEYEMSLVSDTTSLYEFRTDRKNYKLKEIYEAASLVGHRNSEIAAKQVELLENDNEFVRYWALIGLWSQDKAVLGRSKAKILKAVKDTYPPNVILAASLSYENFRDPVSKGLLEGYCHNDNMDLALLTINMLCYVEEKEPFIETIRKVRELPGRTFIVKGACMDFLGSLGLVPNDFDHQN